MKLQDFVVLVDEKGCDLLDKNGKLSTMEKLEAHRRGLLHRATSVVIFNDAGELLLQKRAATKYHSPNKWSNTCCTHPFPGETPVAAAQRRLVEEMGITVPLTESFTFSYKADTDNNLIENEFDHVFVGYSSQNPRPNPVEVSDWKWMTVGDIERDLISNPGKYSPWLKKCLEEVVTRKLQESAK